MGRGGPELGVSLWGPVRAGWTPQLGTRSGPASRARRWQRRFTSNPTCHSGPPQCTSAGTRRQVVCPVVPLLSSPRHFKRKWRLPGTPCDFGLAGPAFRPHGAHQLWTRPVAPSSQFKGHECRRRELSRVCVRGPQAGHSGPGRGGRGWAAWASGERSGYCPVPLVGDRLEGEVQGRRQELSPGTKAGCPEPMGAATHAAQGHSACLVPTTTKDTAEPPVQSPEGPRWPASPWPGVCHVANSGGSCAASRKALAAFGLQGHEDKDSPSPAPSSRAQVGTQLPPNHNLTQATESGSCAEAPGLRAGALVPHQPGPHVDRGLPRTQGEGLPEKTPLGE